MIYYAMIFDEMPHPGWVVDVDGDSFVYNRSNKWHKAVTGLNDIKGLTIDDLGFQPDTAARLKARYRLCLESRQVVQYEEMVPTKNTTTWWLTRLSPVIEDDRVVKVIGISTDITELKEAVSNLEQFVYIISHDMQSPISSINGLVGLLEEECGSNELMKMIKLSAKEAADQISGLLEYSRSGRLDPANFEVVNVAGIIDRVEMIVPCGSKLVRGEILPCTGNEKAIYTVFQNLISNACKFSTGSLVIEISSRPDGEYIVYEVSDNGIGIADKDKVKIFEPFRRLHSKRKYEGSGLGLAITKNIVNRHGGTIRVESPNHLGGSTFVVALKR